MRESGPHVHRRARAVPAHVLAPESASAQGRVRLAEADHRAEEPKDILVGAEPVPVEPTRRVVLVVRVVVAALSLQELVTRAEHGRAVRQHQQAAEVLRLPLPQLQNMRRDSFVAFPAAVPAEVLVRSVRVVVAVGLVMFVVVGNEVVQGEAVVRGNVVDALVRMKRVHPVIREEVVAAVEPLHEGRHQAGVAAHKAPNVIPEAAVPLEARLGGERSPELVRPGRIPWLRDEPDVHWVRVRGKVDRILRVQRTVIVAGQGGGQVEPEAVDVHFLDPITRAVHDQLADARVRAASVLPVPE